MSPGLVPMQESRANGNQDALHIPSDLVIEIITHLPVQDALATRAVCRAWRRAIDDYLASNCDLHVVRQPGIRAWPGPLSVEESATAMVACLQSYVDAWKTVDVAPPCAAGDCAVAIADVARALAYLPRLEHLDLSKCGALTDSVLEAMTWDAGGLPALRGLRLIGTRDLTDAVLPSIVAAAPNLQELALGGAGARFSIDAVAETLEVLPALTSLELLDLPWPAKSSHESPWLESGARLMRAVCRLRNLRSLSLSGILIDRRLWDSADVASLTQLESLSLTSCVIMCGKLAQLAGVPTLRALTIAGPRSIEWEPGAPSFLDALAMLAPTLRVLHLVGLYVPLWSAGGGAGALGSITGLTSLTLRSCSLRGDAVVEATARMSSLESLDLSSCKDVHHTTLLAGLPRGLKRLRLAGCLWCDNNFAMLLRGAKQKFEVLDLTATPLTATGIQLLAPMAALEGGTLVCLVLPSTSFAEAQWGGIAGLFPRLPVLTGRWATAEPLGGWTEPPPPEYGDWLPRAGLWISRRHKASGA
ncbi:unnamed protein product [Pedinophyceae sp. YPF-701]|nr:unnamed protein product [Pedinophyceae sp. YPF-701]